MTAGAGIDFMKNCQLSSVISNEERNLRNSYDESSHIRDDGRGRALTRRKAASSPLLFRPKGEISGQQQRDPSPTFGMTTGAGIDFTKGCQLSPCHFERREKSPEQQRRDLSPTFGMTAGAGIDFTKGCQLSPCHFERREKSPEQQRRDLSPTFEMTAGAGIDFTKCSQHPLSFRPKGEISGQQRRDLSPTFEMTTGAGIDFTKGCQLSPVISNEERNLYLPLKYPLRATTRD